MYEAFYGLKEKPFSNHPDPEYLYLGRRHGFALAMLEYGLRSRASFTVLGGEVGCGKTTLIRHLLNELPEEVTVGILSNAQIHADELFAWVLQAFGLEYEGRSRVALYDAVQEFLIGEYAAGRRVLLIVDEAQNLGPEALEALRVLSNINTDKHELLQIILAGQSRLKELLARPDLRSLALRVAVQFCVSPLDEEEVRPYIEHRLRVAGCERSLFTPEACARIACLSGGRPGSINLLADSALMYGFAAGLEQLDETVLAEVMRDRAEFGLIEPA